MSKAENICRQTGCIPPSCCHDNFIKNISSNDVSRCFPTAVYMGSSLDHMKFPSEEGVFFTDLSILGTEERILLRFNGSCPNQKKNGDCGLGNDKPSACLAEKRGGELCTLLRIRDGRAPLEEKYCE